jgi:hypothetical protein
MKKFGKEMPTIHQLCYNHTIHLAVKDVLYLERGSNYCTTGEYTSDENKIHIMMII